MAATPSATTTKLQTFTLDEIPALKSIMLANPVYLDSWNFVSPTLLDMPSKTEWEEFLETIKYCIFLSKLSKVGDETIIESFNEKAEKSFDFVGYISHRLAFRDINGNYKTVDSCENMIKEMSARLDRISLLKGWLDSGMQSITSYKAVLTDVAKILADEKAKKEARAKEIEVITKKLLAMDDEKYDSVLKLINIIP